MRKLTQTNTAWRRPAPVTGNSPTTDASLRHAAVYITRHALSPACHTLHSPAIEPEQSRGNPCYPCNSSKPNRASSAILPNYLPIGTHRMVLFQALPSFLCHFAVDSYPVSSPSTPSFKLYRASSAILPAGADPLA